MVILIVYSLNILYLLHGIIITQIRNSRYYCIIKERKGVDFILCEVIDDLNTPNYNYY